MIYKKSIRNFIFFTPILIMFLLINSNISGKAITIKTDFNKVGINNTDICRYSRKSNAIICKSGKIFKNIYLLTGSSTGTPPWLMYKNYIGYYLLKSNRYKKLPGQARRVIFCNGKCEL